MGTSGSYSGSGSKAGKNLRRELNDWLDQLPPNPPDQPPPDDRDPERPPSDTPPPNPLPPAVLQSVLSMLRPRISSGSGADGPGGGGGLGRGGAGAGAPTGRTGGGARRSAAGAAGSAGRAGAAAYAYQTGDAAELERLGLRYDELRSLGDPLEVMQRIVVAACGPNESTIEDIDQRYVAAEVAEWVFEQGPTAVPTPEEIVRKTISLMIFETFLSESGSLRDGERPSWASELAENELRDAAEALSQRATLSVDGVSADEFAAAIEGGIEMLRQIVGGAQ